MLYVITIRAQEQIYGGPSKGTMYSMKEACSQCGTGALQEGPLKLAEVALHPKQVTLTLDFEILFGDAVAEELMKQGFDCFVQVRHYQTLEKLPVHQLLPEKILPPFTDLTSGFEISDQCPKCKRDGHFNIPHVPLRLHYGDLHPQYLEHDILATWERWGKSRLRTPLSESHFASPIFVISQKLRDALHGMKGIEFTEVNLN